MFRLFCWYCFLFCLAVVAMPSLIIRGCPDALAKPGPYQVKVYDTQLNQTTRMDLENYIQRVLAAEMPADFSLEALKAQAVAIRTFTLEKLSQPNRTKFGPQGTADFTDRAEDGQAWLNNRMVAVKWGKDGFSRQWSKICRAVSDTRGEVITYRRRLIKAYYHSTCGGNTEDAREWWGINLPYLHGKPCHFDRESPHYQGERFYSWAKWLEATGSRRVAWGKSAAVMSSNDKNIKIIKKTSTGRIKTVSIAGRVMSGESLRRKLALASSKLVFLPGPSGVALRIRGYGHGVGLCQYGANGLARRGLNYRQIIKYYYQDTDIQKIY